MPESKIISKDQFNTDIQKMKNYLKFQVDNSQEDELIIQMMNSAVEQIEKHCNILLRKCTVDCYFEDFDIDSGIVLLPLIPLSDVLNVYLIDEQGIETETTGFYVYGGQAKEVKISTWSKDERIRVRYIGGYGIKTEGKETEPIPETAQLAINKTVAWWYEHRDDSMTLPGEVRRMLNQISYKSWI